MPRGRVGFCSYRWPSPVFASHRVERTMKQGSKPNITKDGVAWLQATCSLMSGVMLFHDSSTTILSQQNADFHPLSM